MAKTISIGQQDFEKLRVEDCFYVDKTSFIREWWDSKDSVTLITRPRRFGKTLNMSMLNCFFSNKYAGRSDLFEGLSIWEDERYREIQGTYPVIFLSFAGVKQDNYADTRAAMNGLIAEKFDEYRELLGYDDFDNRTRKKYDSVCEEMSNPVAAMSLNMLCGFLERRYGKKAIVLLDEYDTPLQEAYMHGFWDELVSYIRALFNNTFKTNTHLERALMTGITRVSKESIFSDLNNLKVITTTSMKYTTAFGFTEEEVFAAMDEQGFDPGLKETVKYWYDGFTFGDTPDIYNPWSITSYLEEKEFNTYWADTSSNGLVGNLLRAGNREFKESFEQLLNDESIQTELDEQIVFSQLGQKSSAVWSLLVASGYLKIVEVDRRDRAIRRPVYTLRLTNLEVKWMFYDLISVWFDNRSDAMPNFIKCMLAGNVEDMNNYLNRIARDTFSSFDTGTHPSESAPERFYHGFVLGLLVDKAADYVVKSNRESGYGRYDVVMEPKDIQNPAVIMEFKVYDERKREQELSDTVANALQQIEDKHYDTDLLARGIPQERIYKYGFAFRGREILIGME